MASDEQTAGQLRNWGKIPDRSKRLFSTAQCPHRYCELPSLGTRGKTARAVRSRTQTSTFAMWPVIYFGNTKQKDVLQCMHQQITQWTVLLYTGVSVANCRCVYLVHYVNVPSTLPQQHH